MYLCLFVITKTIFNQNIAKPVKNPNSSPSQCSIVNTLEALTQNKSCTVARLVYWDTVAQYFSLVSLSIQPSFSTYTQGSDRREEQTAPFWGRTRSRHLDRTWGTLDRNPFAFDFGPNKLVHLCCDLMNWCPIVCVCVRGALTLSWLWIETSNLGPCHSRRLFLVAVDWIYWLLQFSFNNASTLLLSKGISFSFHWIFKHYSV